MPKRPLIIDCDTGEDDAIALVLAVQAGLPLKYVVTCHGNTSIENATRNSSRIMSLMEAQGVQVIRGSSEPLEPHKLEGDNFTVGEDFLGKNGICDIELPASKYDNIHDVGSDRFVEFLAKRIAEEGPVDYIITGPCTNFAKLCMHFGDDIRRYINSLTIMGGAVYVRGTRGAGVRNVSHDSGEQHGMSWAEFNFYCDPKAIDITLAAGLNPVIVTWDQCTKFELEMDFIEKMSSETAGGQFVIDLMKAFMHLFGLKHKTHFELCDPLTVLAHMGYGQVKCDEVCIITDEEYFGKSYSAAGCPPVQYFFADEAEVPEIIQGMMDKLAITVQS